MKQRSGSVVASGGGKSEALCFDKNEFMQQNFSADEFLHRNRNAPSLEQLRDDLGLYLKELRASMIDLINADYADFVSLSTNLIGLDQSIERIRRPLEQFRDEINSVDAVIQENIQDIRKELDRKGDLRVKKRNLQSLKKVYEAMKKLEDLLARQLSEALRPVDLERASLELIQLQFNEGFCEELLEADQRQGIKKLEHEVLEKLRALFNETLKTATSANSEQLERCLRIYVTLDACPVAERVFREDFVAPYMDSTISEQALQNSPQGLAGIYIKVLNFISLHMTDLLRLTQYTDKLRGFHFLVNSFWTEVERRLEAHMSSIFAPGNSEVFYAKYKCTRDFLAKIEELLAADSAAVASFRQHAQTRSFQAKWNLPVYFQICFQEIAGRYEAALEPLLRDDSLPAQTPSAGHPFQLSAFKAAATAIQSCWAEGVFLPEVFPKFFKLHLQIILRLSRWITDLLQVLAGKACPAPAKLNRTQILIALHGDVQELIRQLPTMRDEAWQNLPEDKQRTPGIKDAVAKSFAELETTLSAHLGRIQGTLVEILVGESATDNVRQVNDLPRLYRKTNREVPARPSGYVEQMLRPLKAFATPSNEEKLSAQVVNEVLRDVCSRITADYFAVVSDVLTSVQRTEESLKRLRSLKSGAAPASVSAASAAVSDDDKIRLQLRVDVAAWSTELAELKCHPSDVGQLLQLNQIVEESTRQYSA